MEALKYKYIQLDHLVQIPGTFESPEYVPDYIAVAAEECSGSYSQGSLSPETYISTDDNNLDFLDDLPHVNEDVANEIVNDMVYEDPSFGSVLIDGDICDILKVEADDYDVLENESFPNHPLVHDTSTRRKQRIVPIANEPFESGLSSYLHNDRDDQTNPYSRKRLLVDSDDKKYPSKKLILSEPVLTTYHQGELQENKMESSYLSFLEKNDFDSIQQRVTSDNDKLNTCIRQRKRGLTQDERKERKKQSNRNASYRYRQRKKEEMDNFYQESVHVLDNFEKEKEAYQNVVEEFIRCIKHAQLVNDARGERRKDFLLKA